jgi:hypothetical protein
MQKTKVSNVNKKQVQVAQMYKAAVRKHVAAQYNYVMSMLAGGELGWLAQHSIFVDGENSAEISAEQVCNALQTQELLCEGLSNNNMHVDVVDMYYAMDLQCVVHDFYVEHVCDSGVCVRYIFALEDADTDDLWDEELAKLSEQQLTDLLEEVLVM